MPVPLAGGEPGEQGEEKEEKIATVMRGKDDKIRCVCAVKDVTEEEEGQELKTSEKILKENKKIEIKRKENGLKRTTVYSQWR